MAVERVYDEARESFNYNQPLQQPETKTSTVKRKVVVKLTRLEKVLYISLITMIALVSIYVLSLKMDAYDTRGKIADLEAKIEKQSSQNSALKSETMKNSSYERIYDKAEKQGMSLQNDNVKVVRKDGEAKN
ncbi:cell division protein FtsL [Staphylococcus massiliensis]|uniref:Cell division protein FtsL n=1 Tax=Staphylococcus massiliensis S46 TaxID=1229783 RepID=K9ASN7_9STAP|nr:cell division protein FtsL [Staphylococcus massiliensis]EKU50378.1 cell division protein [Staphylococcus massiliensis S46]MCG3398852.1 cell division protein FtsL [Staphylococcus massiliensis]MCG3401413.1 cell division protein FtsL [Staphylococcus massiliensis]MCG3411805.1 cell division protein FtsL [Staphylococcus massiliensis]PNZ99736.1 cell division protein FtsL [Staphylococcus massiliensis CCUG 55927]